MMTVYRLSLLIFAEMILLYIQSCKTSRKMKDISIFTVPTKAAAAKNPAISKWRDELLNIVKRDREDPNLIEICQLSLYQQH